ncbi:hypothetical protein KFE25_004447 [Diacronema lutheri]|uniref:K Homology domain-containing protein n=1 Tax=Diacronema lutheri TaxID=2081491 RepID=A0A8J5XA19_DIALT|nr:hypothetical protein KFE25_004447 [Diacronema lutheri]
MEGARTIAPDELRASAAAARDARMADRDAAAPEHDDDDDDAGDADGDADAEMGGGGKRTRAADGSAAKPDFPRLKQQAGAASEHRIVLVPPHRMTPLKQNWMALYTPIVEQLKLDIRMNPRRRCVELRTSAHTMEAEVLQKAADFLKAFMLGFDVPDALALLRLDDLFVESFDVTDVKLLHGDHLGRAVGRVAGKDGKTKFAIENATRTRIVLADQKVHILGSVAHIRVARDAICALILGSPPGKVYNSMRTTAARLLQRF